MDDARLTGPAGVTQRLVIEPLDVEHAEGLHAALDHPDVGRYIGGPDVTTATKLIERIRLLRQGPAPGSGQRWLNWAVRLQHDDRVIIGRIEATVHDGLAEVAYVFGPNYSGNGYATEAVGWLTAYLVDEVGCHDVFATVLPENTGSVKLLQRSGFVEVESPPDSLMGFDDGDFVYKLDVEGQPNGQRTPTT